MAIIGSIRKRSFLLLVIIGLALLAFVLGDAFGNGGLGGQQQLAVGEIDGVDIDAGELDAKTSYWSDLYARSYNQQISRDQARNLAWQDIVKEKILMRDINTAGLRFTTDEFDDVRYGAGALPEFINSEFYKDEAGNFDPNRVKQTYSGLFNAEDPNSRKTWIAEKDRLMNQRLTMKYNTLVSKTLAANNLEAAEAYKGKSATVDIQYVLKKYTDLKDDEVEVSDGDIRSFFNAHSTEKRFKQTASRDIKALVFPVVATQDDKDKILADITSEVDRFTSAQNDSLFVVINSDVRSYSVLSKTRAQVDSTIANRLFSSAVGTVVGPYLDGKNYKLAKIVGDDKKEEATVRHILLKSDPSNDLEKKTRADSLVKAIKRGADFEQLVTDFTEDPGSKATGGKYEWFPRGQMVPEFEDFSFDEPNGSIGVVKTSYGYHVIEVIDHRSEPQRKIVEFIKNIVPSAETYDKVYTEANTFVVDHNSAADFESGAEALGMTVKPANGLRANVSNVAGVSNAREVVRWAYEATSNIGDVSSPIEAGEQFVVSLLTGSRESGLPIFEDVKDEMRTEVLKEKKAAQFIADLGTYSSLAEAATNVGGTVQSASSVSYSALNIVGAGREPEVVGTAFSLNEGEISVPLKGNFGVYVVQVDSKNNPNTDGVDYSNDLLTIKNQHRSAVTSTLNKALNDAHGVESQMDRFY